MENQMTVKKWIGTLFILAIPIVNIIFLLMWAFGKENPRKNFSRAALIVYSITIGLALILGTIASILEANQAVETSTFDEDLEQFREQEAKELNTNLVVSDVYIDNKESFKSVIVKIKNNSNTESYSGFTVELNIYNAENSILETREVAVEDTIPPGEVLELEDWQPVHGDAASAKVIDIR